MPLQSSLPRRVRAVRESLVGDVPTSRASSLDQTVRFVEEFVEFLVQVEAVVGRDDQPRPATRGERFLL